MIPSQNAIRHTAILLRHKQHAGLYQAIVEEFYGEPNAAQQLRLQAHDFGQVAQFLEERIVNYPISKRKHQCPTEK